MAQKSPQKVPDDRAGGIKAENNTHSSCKGHRSLLLGWKSNKVVHIKLKWILNDSCPPVGCGTCSDLTLCSRWELQGMNSNNWLSPRCSCFSEQRENYFLTCFSSFALCEHHKAAWAKSQGLTLTTEFLARAFPESFHFCETWSLLFCTGLMLKKTFTKLYNSHKNLPYWCC